MSQVCCIGASIFVGASIRIGVPVNMDFVNTAPIRASDLLESDFGPVSPHPSSVRIARIAAGACRPALATKINTSWRTRQIDWSAK
jgi:hypothetical protein